jgi:hypothetical protein
MNLAAFYHDRGRETGAEDLYTRAAAILEQGLGSNETEALVVRNELADVLRAERRYTESEKLSRATLAAMQARFREGDPRLVRAQVNYARLQEETHRLAQAKKIKVKTLRTLSGRQLTNMLKCAINAEERRLLFSPAPSQFSTASMPVM